MTLIPVGSYGNVPVENTKKDENQKNDQYNVKRPYRLDLKSPASLA